MSFRCGCSLAGVAERRGSSNELKGCINDAHCMKYLLTTRLGFREADIVMLTDDQNSPQAWPTRANMVCPEFLCTMLTGSLCLMCLQHCAAAPCRVKAVQAVSFVMLCPLCLVKSDWPEIPRAEHETFSSFPLIDHKPLKPPRGLQTLSNMRSWQQRVSITLFGSALLKVISWLCSFIRCRC